MADPRLQKILQVSSRLFIKPGYAQTQVDHIVKACGISVGALYDLFSGKKAILQFVLKCVMEPAYAERDLPLPLDEECFLGLEKEVEAFFAEKSAAFSKPLLKKSSRYPFAQMLSDAYDTIRNYGPGLLILENNPSTLPKLFLHYKNYRSRFFSSLLGYLRFYRDKGRIVLQEDPELAVMFIIESMTWWGADRKYDSFEMRDDIPDTLAKTVCLDTLLRAYKK